MTLMTVLARKSGRLVGVLVLLLACVLGLASCGGSSNVTYADGTYTGQSSVHEGGTEDGEDAGNGYGVVTITIQDGKISSCEYLTYEPDGTLKDENYGMVDGKVSNRDYYNKAQKAIAACEEYVKMLVADGNLDDVEAISGATINYDEFIEAVNDALSQAAES